MRRYGYEESKKVTHVTENYSIVSSLENSSEKDDQTICNHDLSGWEER